MHIELNQFWLCGNSVLDLHIIDEIMVTKTMVEMTKCYFKCMWIVNTIFNVLLIIPAYTITYINILKSKKALS